MEHDVLKIIDSMKQDGVVSTMVEITGMVKRGHFLMASSSRGWKPIHSAPCRTVWVRSEPLAERIVHHNRERVQGGNQKPLSCIVRVVFVILYWVLNRMCGRFVSRPRVLRWNLLFFEITHGFFLFVHGRCCLLLSVFSHHRILMYLL